MHNIQKKLPLTATALAALLGITGCGGGGSGTPSSAVPGPTASQGVITALGSIFVNGTEYSTTSATVTVDDNPGVPGDLKVGMVVKVRGASDDRLKQGTATHVEVRNAMEGQIESIDNVAHTITVMGQVVHIEDNVTRLMDNDTLKVFGDAAFIVGEFVQVHGVPDDLGGLRASRVILPAIHEFESKGFIVNLAASSFGLSLTPGGTAFITVNFTAGLLPALTANGSLVEVKSLIAPVAGVITASLIHLEDTLAAVGEKVEVEGIVSSGTVTDFFINGREVLTNSSTMFKGGLAADFALGLELEAEGPLNASGAIVASEVSFHSSIRIEADLTALVPGASLSLLGQNISINPFTRIVTPIAVGNHIQVRAKVDRNNTLIATRIINLGASSNNTFLQGPVSAMDSTAGTLTVLGLTLISDSTSQWRVSSTASDLPATKAAFFTALVPNVSVVKVKWSSATPLTTPFKEAEIEEGK